MYGGFNHLHYVLKLVINVTVRKTDKYYFVILFTINRKYNYKKENNNKNNFWK